MGLSKKTKQSMFDNTHCRYSRLASGERLTLEELLRISDKQERELMAYMLAQSESRFNKLMKVYGEQWRQYTKMKLRNRARMKELC